MTTKKLPDGRVIDLELLSPLIHDLSEKKVHVANVVVKESHRSGLSQKHYTTHADEKLILDSRGFLLFGLPRFLKAKEKDEKFVHAVVVSEEILEKARLQS